jgi:hypothetical protein
VPPIIPFFLFHQAGSASIMLSARMASILPHRMLFEATMDIREGS